MWLFLYIHGATQLCIVYEWTISSHLHRVRLPAQDQLRPCIYSSNQARASLCFLTQKEKSESYIFYKLSAVKEGAKKSKP